MSNAGAVTDDFEGPAPKVDEAGVDVTLIRWMPSLTPKERLEFLENRIAALTRHGMPLLSRDGHFDAISGLKRVGW